MGNKNKQPEFDWPEKPVSFPALMTPVEAAMFLRLDEIGHNPGSAQRSLNYWREHGELKATKYARHVWFLKKELEAFLNNKTES
ncbi:MAG: helix-turn-helix domain-containing protein [Sedimentisphaerales bacterium]|nr:helix-turn-helix domain-containing protein [Sedimentisphaerales bacterium]